jgi:hypothetical protein
VSFTILPIANCRFLDVTYQDGKSAEERQGKISVRTTTIGNRRSAI